MPTARTLLDSALREPMQAAGWTPKASGWFTRPMSPEYLGVVATGVATKHSAAGEGQATAHVGLRVEAVEQAVAAICGMKDGGYKQRTTVLGLGYTTPERRWLDWTVTAESVAAVADHLAGTVSESGLLYLEHLVRDPNTLLGELPQVHSAMDLGRKVVLLVRVGRAAEASEALREHLGSLARRTDAAAVHTREIGARLIDWVREHEG